MDDERSKQKKQARLDFGLPVDGDFTITIAGWGTQTVTRCKEQYLTQDRTMILYGYDEKTMWNTRFLCRLWKKVDELDGYTVNT